ncbi:hypothetical protein sos41_17920 [Alphaproteobacteria bacterium SO-S41]|nr:hypothetical protein sos41_17920 [Alphaproteobacteria bacterium SO-S41]
MRTILTAILAAAAFGAVPSSAADPVRVMILGTTHMSNANQDKMNVSVDDVLTEKRQAELVAINDALARFAPTEVAVEWPAALADERYAKYLDGSLEPSRNEVVQVGFRLAKTLGLTKVHGIDVDGDFPFEPVEAYAKAHDQTAILDDAMNLIEVSVAATQEKVDTGSLGGVLRYLNEPAHIVADNAFYRVVAKIGGGGEQPGALLLAAWQKRNLLTCARLVQLSQPGDRVVVLFGSGHAFLLRQCVTETPGFELVEPNDFLPE